MAEVDQRRVATERGERPGEHEPDGALRVIDREALGIDTAHGVAHDHYPSEPQGIRERRHILREIARPVACRRAIRVAMAPLREGERVDGRRQVRQNGREGVPGVGDAM